MSYCSGSLPVGFAMSKPIADYGYAEALPRIKICHESAQTSLDLSGLGLITLPPEMGQLTALTALFLGDNRLTVLPPEIGQLTALTTLDLSGNRLAALPPEIGQLTALTTLDLGGNRLFALPPEIGQLTALTELYLGDNWLSALPPDITRLTALTALDLGGNQLSVLPPEITRLTSLTDLYLRSNQLSVLPLEITRLTALTTLSLGDNQLSALPPEITRLTALTDLSLNGNQLSVLPPEITRLTALTKLSLGGNGLTMLPPEITRLTSLTDLSLNDNQLSALPPEITRLTALTKLYLGGNRLTVLPPVITRLTTLTELYLSDNRLTVLPPEITRLTALTKLYLSDNRFAALPPEITRLTALTALYLGGNQLSALPPEIIRLTSLTTLYLRSNRLFALPPEITRLTSLTTLYLSGNRLTVLPPVIGQLTALTDLDLGGNRLAVLPPEIGRLTALTELSLGDNQLAVLPPEIGRLTALTALYLRGNQLTVLPPEIGQLTALTGLYLRSNRLTVLPPEIGRLTTLTGLYLSDNGLTVLPPEIGQLAALTELDLSGNGLTALPPEITRLTALTELDLRRNRLTALPLEITRLTALTMLHLDDNPDIGIPPEVLNKGDLPEIISWYLRNQAATTKRPILEAKVILVGWGAVGKTSLRRRLVNKTFNANEVTTHKIDITPWPVRLGNDEIKLHVWDFGGQEIMHATHQFFLTKRSLYVLVLAGREKTQGAQDAEYWLRLIKSFGGGSPVIVVLNKQHACSFDLDRNTLQEKYPFIRAFVQTDCAPQLHLGDLEELILRELDRLPELRREFDAKWMAIKDAVTDLKRQGRKRMTVEEYFALCRQKQEPDEEWQKWLLGFLHDLGVVVCFHEDARLANDGVLDPQWVVDGIYKILNEPGLEGGDGRVTYPQVRALLSSSEYTPDDVRILLDLMERFQLCFWLGTDRTEFVVPELMTERAADWKKSFPDSEQYLRFELKYDFLPEGLVPRFIVATHDLSRTGERWRSGVILRVGKNTALVRGDAAGSPPLIRILVNGPNTTRRELLAIIRREFEKINASIPGLEVEERVPIPGYNVESVNYNHLVTAEAMGEKTWNIFAPGVLVKMPLSQLLDGIELKSKRQARAKKLKEKLPTSATSGNEFHIHQYGDGPVNINSNNNSAGGSIINSQVGQSLTNCTNIVGLQPAGERKDLLEALTRDVERLIKAMPAEKQEDAPQVANNLEALLKQAASTKPDRKWYSLSAEGLLEASTWVKDFSGNIGGTILNLGKSIWSDFKLPI